MTNERLIGGHSSTVVTTRFEEVKSGEELIPPLPTALERHIRVVKDSDTLGVQVDIEEEGINGLVVRYVIITNKSGLIIASIIFIWAETLICHLFVSA